MPTRALLIEVSFLNGRYHGVSDWPPAPFRLFQALVASAYGGRWRLEPDESEKDAAFHWLERLPPPYIAVPAKIDARTTTYFVPNNDIDAVDGDTRRISEIRGGKRVRPILLTIDAPVLYAWPFDEGDDHAQRISTFVERLHTLGSGIDAAFARAAPCDWVDAEARLTDHPGSVLRPGKPGDPEQDPLCPIPGSLDSLKKRYAAGPTRFTQRRQGRATATLFNQSPKALARAMTYGRAPARLLFDLRSADNSATFHPVPQEQACKVAIAVRDLAAWRLKLMLPERKAEIDRLVIGRDASAADIERRIRIVPLPSIGHVHTSPSIRRVLVEIPPDCPLSAGAVTTALSNQSLDRINEKTGEIIENVVTKGTILMPASDDSMLWHYGISSRGCRRWRTVTPAALSQRRLKGRISGGERAAAEKKAAAAVVEALRHAGLGWRDITVRVQREPFRLAGVPADKFDPDRFAEGLRHVEIVFPQPVAGPLVIGDGRWLGLGVMAPVRQGPPSVHVFAIDPAEAPPFAARETLIGALRNAVMARVDDEMGGDRGWRGKKLPTFFTGHLENGAPARSGRHEHLFFMADDADADGKIDRLAIVAPHLADHTVAYDPDRRSAVRDYLDVLDRAMADFTLLRAGHAGAPPLTRLPEPGDDDPLFGRAKVWVSRTPYRPTRHAGRGKDLKAALIRDVTAECGRRGLPRPVAVDIIDVVALSDGEGLKAHLRLRFARAVRGPLLVGRDSHQGGGLFFAYAMNGSKQLTSETESVSSADVATGGAKVRSNRPFD